MSEDYEKLKLIGIQRIHEETHISREHVIAVVNSDFKTLNRVQFLGFISIFEREYSLDLSVLREQAIAYYDEQKTLDDANPGVFIVAKSNKKSPLIFIAIAVLIMIVFAFFSLNGNKSDVVEVQTVEHEIIVDAKKNIEANESDNNSTDTNQTLEVEEKVVETALVIEKNTVEQKSVVIEEFSITPKSRVWIGYIDVENNKKYQNTIKEKLTLKGQKEWLVILGHSHVLFNVSGEEVEYKNAGNLYLHYKDGKLERVSKNEFKALNKGRQW